MKSKRVSLLGGVLLFGLLALWGCPKSMDLDVTTSPDEQKQETTAAQVEAQKEEERKAEAAKKAADEAAAAEAAKRAEQEAQERAAREKEAAGLQPIYFDFDKSFVRDDAKSIMKANAEWLKANPKVKVRIEGNCDDRGTKEYNQALGQRRATSTKKYLTDLGISAKRISLISYGKEKPVCSDNSEDCWQKNRRGDLVAVTN